MRRGGPAGAAALLCDPSAKEALTVGATCVLGWWPLREAAQTPTLINPTNKARHKAPPPNLEDDLIFSPLRQPPLLG